MKYPYMQRSNKCIYNMNLRATLSLVHPELGLAVRFVGPDL